MKWKVLHCKDVISYYLKLAIVVGLLLAKRIKFGDFKKVYEAKVMRE